MFSRLLKAPLKTKKSFFLFGPRGTGKTYWVKTQFPTALYLDLLETSLYIDLLANPQKLEQLIPKGYTEWIIIDEVQKIPALLNEVHRLIEKYGYSFILTGSSARSLRKKGVNLLAGRALTFHLYPLTFQELGDAFNLERVLNYGTLPAIFSEEEVSLYLRSYVTTYLKEEILQEGLTRSLSAFTRFLEIASFSQGQLVNMSEIARQSAISRKMVESYFEILEDLLLAYTLPVFTKRATRQLTAHPKFYFFDTGVFRSIRPKGPFDRTEEIDGAALETFFLQEIKALNDYLGLEYDLFYWRTASQMEVDFVLYGPRGIIAFEIKRSRSISKKDCNGLIAFGKDYPEAKLFILYGGKRREYFDNIQAIPFEEALPQLPTLL